MEEDDEDEAALCCDDEVSFDGEFFEDPTSTTGPPRLFVDRALPKHRRINLSFSVILADGPAFRLTDTSFLSLSWPRRPDAFIQNVTL